MCIDSNQFTDKPKILENFICGIGLGIIDEPLEIRCKNGSHVFCKECLDKHLQQSNKCPLCQECVTKTFPSMVMRNIISTFEFVCLCGWKDFFGNYVKHRETCVEAIIDCPYDLVGCVEKIKRKDLNTHLETNKYHYAEYVNSKHKFISILSDKELKTNLKNVPNQGITNRIRCEIGKERKVTFGELKLNLLFARDLPTNTGVFVGNSFKKWKMSSGKYTLYSNIEFQKYTDLTIKFELASENLKQNFEQKYTEKENTWKNEHNDITAEYIDVEIKELNVNY